MELYTDDEFYLGPDGSVQTVSAEGKKCAVSADWAPRMAYPQKEPRRSYSKKVWGPYTEKKKPRPTKEKKEEQEFIDDVPLVFLHVTKRMEKKAKKEEKRKIKKQEKQEHTRATILEENPDELNAALHTIFSGKRHLKMTRRDEWTWTKMVCALIARIEAIGKRE